jgi:hypothetical protein
MDNSTSSRNYWLKGLALFLPALLLLGCNSKVNLVQGVAPVQPIPDAKKPVGVMVSGVGKCGRIEIDWGDTDKDDYQYVDLGKNPVFTHTYGQGGGKTVTVEGKFGCGGKVNTRFVLEPSVFSVGFAQAKTPPTPTPPTCAAPSNHPGVRQRELVRITTIPATGGVGIDFGCPFQGCRYDADGKPGSVAAPPFPFPGLREYSLVLRVDKQVVQGGTNMSFIATHSGPLELCLNDPDMTNNVGGYQVDIRIDQLGP